MHARACALSLVCLSPRLCAVMSPLAPCCLLLLTPLSVVSFPCGPEKEVLLKETRFPGRGIGRRLLLMLFSGFSDFSFAEGFRVSGWCLRSAWFPCLLAFGAQGFRS